MITDLYVRVFLYRTTCMYDRSYQIASWISSKDFQNLCTPHHHLIVITGQKLGHSKQPLKLYNFRGNAGTVLAQEKKNICPPRWSRHCVGTAGKAQEKPKAPGTVETSVSRDWPNNGNEGMFCLGKVTPRTGRGLKRSLLKASLSNGAYKLSQIFKACELVAHKVWLQRVSLASWWSFLRQTVKTRQKREMKGAFFQTCQWFFQNLINWLSVV